MPHHRLANASTRELGGGGKRLASGCPKDVKRCARAHWTPDFERGKRKRSALDTYGSLASDRIKKKPHPGASPISAQKTTE